MKNRLLWKIAVRTTPEAEEAVTELLHEVFGAAPVSYTDLDTGILTVSAYLESDPNEDPGVRARLKGGLDHIRRCGLGIRPGGVSIGKVRRENWAESWKKHFKPFEIGPELLIKPGWSRRRGRKGQAVVILDPGLSFGTGHHPTTGFCLRQLATARTPGQSQSFLDIGTGSGILAIAAAKLGYSRVHAFDFDPESVKVAKANARANGVSRSVRIARGDVTKMPLRGRLKYSVVCANLITPLLVSERARIESRVEPGGLLVLAGILRPEFDLVREAYETAGLRLAVSRAEKEWRSGAFSKARR